MSMDSETFLREYTIRAMSEGRIAALRWALGETIGMEGLRTILAFAFYYAAMWVLVDRMYIARFGGPPQPVLSPVEEHLVALTFVVSLIAARKVVEGIDHPWLN